MNRAAALALWLPLATGGCSGRDISTGTLTLPSASAGIPAGSTATASGDTSTPAPSTATPGQLALRITASGLDDANGRHIGVAVVDAQGRVAATSAGASTVLAGGGAEIDLDKALVAGQTYSLVYYVDMNGDGICDAAPVDSGGTLPFTAGQGDTQVALSPQVGTTAFACGVLGQRALTDENHACSPNADHQYMKAIPAVSADVSTAGSHGLNIFPVCSFFPKGILD